MKKYPKVTQAVKSSVHAYLMARTMAELERERVDKIQRRLLETAEYYTDPKHLTRGRTECERIIDPKHTYLMRDDEFIDYMLDLKHALVKTGYKIKQVPGQPEHCYYCPALVAESLQRDTEQLIVEAGAEMLGEKDPREFLHQLLCAGMETYHKYIDLVVRLVVNMPDFKNPIAA